MMSDLDRDLERTALERSIIDDVIMVGLAFLSAFLLIFEVTSELTPEQARTLEYADMAIAFIFLSEFLYRLGTAANKAHFLRRHWWELLASIPITNETTRLLRTLRVLRLIRLVRLLRIIRLAVRLKILASASERFASETHLIQIATVTAAVALSGALGFHYMEAGRNPNVHGFWDCFWWTMTTITTVGYGDIYPVTDGGRILAIFLMLGGIGTLGMLTASLAAYLVRHDAQHAGVKKKED